MIAVLKWIVKRLEDDELKSVIKNLNSEINDSKREKRNRRND